MQHYPARIMAMKKQNQSTRITLRSIQHLFFRSQLILIITLAVILPVLSHVLEPMYNVFVGRMRGEAYLAAKSVVNSICVFCRMPGSLGVAIGYGVCGMSIVFKRMSKKLEKIVAE